MREINNGMKCKNCGASVTSEICQYCGSPTGLNTADADMEYPVLDCKEANISFWTVVFPGIFAGSFGLAGILVTFFLWHVSQGGFSMALIGVPFLMIGGGAAVVMLIPIIRYIKLKIHGKQIEATVYGYVDDNLLMNGVPAQVVKLLVNSPQGPRFIMYQLGNTSHPYGINTKLSLMVYKNYFMIDKRKQRIEW